MWRVYQGHLESASILTMSFWIFRQAALLDTA
jgi:hypothetical protein